MGNDKDGKRSFSGVKKMSRDRNNMDKNNRANRENKDRRNNGNRNSRDNNRNGRNNRNNGSNGYGKRNNNRRSYYDKLREKDMEAIKNDPLITEDNLEGGFNMPKSKENSAYYIGKFFKKTRKFGFVDVIEEEQIAELKKELNFDEFLSGEKYNIQNIKKLEDSVHINDRRIGTANNGDIVLIEVFEEEIKPGVMSKEGNIRYILKRNKNSIVGIFTMGTGFGFVKPKDQSFISDIFIPKKEVFGAKNDDIVEAEITKYVNEPGKSSEGRIIKIVARAGESHKELKTLLADKGIEQEFPPEVEFEAQNIVLDVTEEERQKRVDLRDIYTVTIDGEDAKDLDDAVAIEKKDGIYTVWVSIADVSHYVKEGSAIDKEAEKRGNSIYLIDTVVPMLPTVLSNDICSLNANEQRCAMTVKAEIDSNGNILKSEVFKSVIEVDKRLSYLDAENILAGEEPEHEFKEGMLLLDELTKILIEKRTKEGYLNFDIPEIKVILDDEGYAVDVEYAKRYFSHKIIENMMILANIIVAKKYNEMNIPVIYRIHENPNPERVEEINEMLKDYGVKINLKTNSKGEKFVTQKEYQRVLQKIDELKKAQDEKYGGVRDLSKDSKYIDYAYVSFLLLRSMQKAKYSEHNDGHFGIGSKNYLHFTSPIRRYADLFTHRMITKSLKEEDFKDNSKEKEKYFDEAMKVSVHISDTERIAIDLERTYNDIKVGEYTERFVGKTFDGTVVAKPTFGIFVNIGKEIEGLVRAKDLEEAGKSIDDYIIGGSVRVTVTEVEKDTGKINLVLEDN